MGKNLGFILFFEPLVDTPLMTTSLEVLDSLINGKPSDLVEILKGLTNDGVVLDGVNVGRVVIVSVSMAGVEILVCLTKIATDACLKTQLLMKFTIESLDVIFIGFDFALLCQVTDTIYLLDYTLIIPQTIPSRKRIARIQVSSSAICR